MAKKKSIEELKKIADEAAERAKEAKKQLAEATKAEQGKVRAEVMDEIDKFRKELKNEKIELEEMPNKIREWQELAQIALGLAEVIEGNPNKEEVKGILLDWIAERKTNNSTFKRRYKGMF